MTYLLPLLLSLSCAPTDNDTSQSRRATLPGLMVVELRAPCDNSGIAVVEDDRLTEAAMITTFQHIILEDVREYSNSTRWTLYPESRLEAGCYAAVAGDVDLVVQMLLQQD
jgi:hypothetical protein